jgi:hypothetical protein
MVIPFVVFDEEFFLDQARFLAELSHSEVKTDIVCLGYGTEWKVVYRFGLCYITLRFKVSSCMAQNVSESEVSAQVNYDLILEWEHFRVSPRHHGIGKKFAEIFLEELKLTPVKQVVLQPKNEEASRFWRAVGFKALDSSATDFPGYLSMDLLDKAVEGS